MQETIRIQEILFTFENKLSEIKSHYYPNEDFAFLFDLFSHRDDIKIEIGKIDNELKQMGTTDSEQYHILTNKKNNLLKQHKETIEKIKIAQNKYDLSKKDSDKNIAEKQKDLESQLNILLTEELSIIKTKIDTLTQDKTEQYEEKKEDLLNAKALCEITLKELKNKEEKITHNSEKKEEPPSYFELFDDLKGTRKKIYSSNEVTSRIEKPEFKIPNDTKEKPSNMEKPEFKVPDETKQKQYVKIPSFKLYDDLYGTEKWIYYSRRKSDNVKKSDFKIIDDMQAAHEEYKNVQNDKKIYAHIEQKSTMFSKDFAIPISSINKPKKTLYDEIGIHKICEEIAGGGTLGKLRGSYLAKKLNPTTIKILDSIGNSKMLQDYIKSIYCNKTFPFDLSYNLRDLNAVQKWKFQKSIKSEEKSGAKIIGKLFDKNISLPESPKSSFEKDKTTFMTRTKTDGKNEEVAENFRKNSQNQRENESSYLDTNDPHSFH